MSEDVAVPDGFLLRFEHGVRALSHDGPLLGGSPLRLMRFSPAGWRVVGALRSGVAVGAAGPGAGLLARRLVAAGIADAVPPGGGPRPSAVTVVVPVRDRAASLGRLLAAVGPCAEVVVADDGSVDGSGAVASAAGARVLRVGSPSRPSGPGGARAAAAAAARTPYVAFLDSDVLPPPGWLGGLLPWFDDPAVGAVAPRVVSLPGPSLLERYEAVRSPLDLGPRGGPVVAGSRLAYVPFAALVVRRSLVSVDPALRYGEDVDLVWRLGAAGWTVRYESAVTVGHRPRGSWSAWALQRFRYGSAAAPLAVRHPSQLRPLRGSLLGAGAWGLAACGAPLPAGALLGWAAGRLGARLSAVPRGRLLAAALVLRGQRGVARQLADTATRVWLPLLAGVAAAGRGRPRRVAVTWLAAAAVGPVVADRWAARRPPVPPGPVADLATAPTAGSAVGAAGAGGRRSATPGGGSVGRRPGVAVEVAVRLADDAAYCAGVWWGCVRERTVLPLLPPLRRNT